ncbi:zinc-binding dehydrogenase [Lacicoccus alkaliphilus]|uniref:Alcohol dehydrogenase n=1 Tax=Lacicoccus alkaliphilus DSM 16010 TaxID=1123231 RepID=A0A1M7IKK8_9BACL|nr:zinc-binding dehydrogenase [Salinicoccus alkaliphilus]SHM41250.1 alcohol dehydrogenase, propanol-preferring [Salinicoccus alkaliphilus DSM 16010]
MKGWQFVDTNKPLELVEKEDPKVEAGKVVIDMKVAGLCHSDVGVLRDEGWKALLGELPVIMGHEVAGIISEVGDGVTEYQVGDKVAVCPTGPSGTAPGYAYDGGFGTKVQAPAEDLVKIPDGVSFAQAAAGTDAGMTSYHAAFNKGGIKKGMKVGMIGIGGLGQIALEAAVAQSIEVYAIDLSPDARQLAKDLGAAGVYENVKEIAEFEPEVIIDYAGFDITTREALESVGFQGKVVLVGMGKLETTINVTEMITKQATLVGSNGGTKQDIEDMYALMAEGKVSPKITEISFDEIPEGIQMLEEGKVTGRLVADMEK